MIKKTRNNQHFFSEWLYETFFKELFLIARGFSRDSHEAKDKLHDFFIEKIIEKQGIENALRKILEDDGECSKWGVKEKKKIRPRICRIFINYLLSRIRGQRRRERHLHVIFADDLLKDLKISNEKKGIDTEGLLDFLLDSEELDYEKKQLLILKYKEGLGNKEIAILYDIKPNAVSSRLKRLHKNETIKNLTLKLINQDQKLDAY